MPLPCPANLLGLLSAWIARSPVAWIAARHDSAGRGYGRVLAAWLAFWMVAGELIPRRLALRYGERWLGVAAYPTYWLMFLVRPLARVPWLVSEMRLVLFGQGTRCGAVSPDELERNASLGMPEGGPEEAQQAVARRALRLADRTVREIMRPRIEIDALEAHTPAGGSDRRGRRWPASPVCPCTKATWTHTSSASFI